MKNIYISTFLSALLLVSFFGFIPAVAAQGDLGGGGGFIENENLGGGGGTTGTGNINGGGTTGGTSGGSTKLANPLKVNTIQELLNLILQVVVTLAVPIIVLFIIYSGFLYVTAQGKPEAIKKATTAFTWTIIGGVIVLGASLLLTVITNTVNALR